MNRRVGGIIAGVSLAAFLVFVVYVGLPTLLDSNVVKGKIARLVRDKIGRPLVIDGDVDISFFPNVRIVLGHCHIDNPEGFAGPVMAEFRGATVAVRLLGLLSGRLDVVELTLDGLEVTLESRDNGVTNWPDLAHSMASGAVWRQFEKTRSVARSVEFVKQWPPMEVGLFGLAAISSGNVHLTEAKIHWRDRKQGLRYSLENISAAGRLLGDGVVGVELAGNWKWHPMGVHGRVSLDYEVHDGGDKLALTGMRAFVASQSERFFLRESEYRASADVVLDIDDRVIAFNGMEMGLTGWFTQNSLRDLEVVVKGMAEWDIDKAVGRMADARLAFKAHSDDLPPAGMNLVVRSGLDWQSQTGLLTMAGVRAEGPAATRLQGDFTVAGLLEGLDKTSIKGKLAVETFDPKALLVAIGQKLPRVMQRDSLSRSTLGGSFEADAQGVRSDHFQLDLDDTHLLGKFSWRDSDPPEVRFDVSWDKLDVDHYWDFLATASGDHSESKPLAAILVPELSMAGLWSWFPENIDLQGSMRGQQVQVSGATLGDFQLAVSTKGGNLTMDPFQFQLYQGGWKQKVLVETRGGDSRMVVEKEMKGIQVQPFLTDVADVNWLSGTMDLSGQLETRGKNLLEARKNLKGSYWLGIKNGALQGIDLTETIRKIVAAVDGRSVSVAEGDQAKASTVLSELTATARVNQGRLTSSDLLAVSNSSIIKGKGEADLVEMTVDYTFSADAQAALKGMDIPYWDRLEGAVLPIHIVGPLQLLGKPNIGEPQLTRRVIAARQGQQGGSHFQGQQPSMDNPSSLPLADADQRNRHPVTRWRRGLFP